jgi:hypothetical protein
LEQHLAEPAVPQALERLQIRLQADEQILRLAAAVVDHRADPLVYVDRPAEAAAHLRDPLRIVEEVVQLGGLRDDRLVVGPLDIDEIRDVDEDGDANQLERVERGRDG